ncbi:MAG: cytochrome c biogenesis protein CcsA [Rudaea sp.]|uniref:cytochrome C assembly family protein n=1 Tax=Rudaea sp. TaxID=2136325 RepID=UPI0039E51E7E
MLATASTLLAIALYLTGAAILALPLLHRQAQPRAIGTGLGALAVVLHFAVLFGVHRGGVDLHFFAALSLVGACIAALCVFVNLSRPVATLGVIVFPLASLLLGIDAFLAPSTQPMLLPWQIKLHALFALLGYSVLSIAAVLAILLALQERALHARRFDGLVRTLPPLTLTEALMFRLIGAGFVLLTLTLITGILFVTNLFDQHLAHKTILSIAAWIVFGALLLGRWRYGWRGRRAVNLVLIGMALLLLAFFGSRFVLELVLKRVP